MMSDEEKATVRNVIVLLNRNLPVTAQDDMLAKLQILGMLGDLLKPAQKEDQHGD